MIRCFCLSAKAMHLWRDVCLWHVEEYICHHEALPSVITYEVLNVIARSKATWQSPGRAPHYKTHARYFIMGPNGILCTRGEKSHTSKRMSIIAPITRFQKCSYRGPRGILCTRGEKAHTSKRVSIIACNNVISKAKCAPYGRVTASRTLLLFM